MSDSRRVTCRRRHLLNEFLLKFLAEFADQQNVGVDAGDDKSQKLRITYKNAYSSLKKFPLEIYEHSLDEQLKDLKFFGPFLINKLKKRLVEFKREFGDLSFEFLGDDEEKVKKTPISRNKSTTSTKMTKILPNTGKYTPKRGSGAYSILLALYDRIDNHDESTKIDFARFAIADNDLRQSAEKYSNEPMLKPSAERHYTAFSCMTSLKTKNLVSTRFSSNLKGEKLVFLTQDGYQLAKRLKIDVPTVEKIPIKSSGFIYSTPENRETLFKNLAHRRLDEDFGLEMYRIKATVNFLETDMQDRLYKIDDDTATVADSSFVFAYLNGADAPERAPGFSTISADAGHFDAASAPSCSQIDGDIDVVLLVDCAETLSKSLKNNKQSRQLLNNFLKTSGVKYEERKLNVGDYLWIARKNDRELVLDTVVERKRLDDLAKSIKDNRWYSQKYRLKQCGLGRVIYLFENMTGPNVGLNPETLENAIVNASVQDGFEVYRTNDVKDTARFLTRVTKFFEKTLQEITNDRISFEEFQNLASINRKFDVETSLAAIFSQIPGVSVELSQNLASKFGTLSNFRKTSNLESILREMDLGGRCGRKVGASLAQKIVEFMDIF
uniref:Crossover junction endonuclease MUS81 n=1 Tax=Romanomermis culicivorax TaxID=13658 RepID=A0A915I0Z0_ROMCU